MVSLGEVGVSGAVRRPPGRRCQERAWRGRAGAHGGAFAFGGGNLPGAGAAAGVRGVPVCQGVAGVGEVGAEVLVGEVAQSPGGVGIGRLAESVVEVGGGGEDFLQRGEDAVVGGGQLG